jgi:hypothetical protein
MHQNGIPFCANGKGWVPVIMGRTMSVVPVCMTDAPGGGALHQFSNLTFTNFLHVVNPPGVPVRSPEVHWWG